MEIVKLLLLSLILFSECLADPGLPFVEPSEKAVVRLKSAVIETSKGRLIVELYPEEAPRHVANFKYLADKGYYTNTTFHIVKPRYIIQGGDKTGTGKGGPGYSIEPEFNRHRHETGTLGMARLSDVQNPDRSSNGGQFYITLSQSQHMDGLYTVFGKVVRGLDVLDTIKIGDKIEKVTVYVR